MHAATTCLLRLTHDSPDRALKAFGEGAASALAALPTKMSSEGLSAKVEIAHRWLCMHETAESALATSTRAASKAERIFSEMIWEFASEPLVSASPSGEGVGLGGTLDATTVAEMGYIL